MFGFITIREGERAAIWSRTGQARIVDGPRRFIGAGVTVQPLARHAAGPEEYLVVSLKDGSTEHHRGPTAVWFDPVRNSSVRAVPLLRLDANEAVVVYRPADGRVNRRVERGPALFIPVSFCAINS